jgi:HPt (histidine-containing phosphotransfer) domain-containing protein
VLGDLDPTGANGVLREVLGVFGASLEPFIALLERHRSRGNASGIKFEVHKLASAAAQMGAMRLSAACKAITRHFDSEEFRMTPARLDDLVDSVLMEAVRVQRKVRQLLS